MSFAGSLFVLMEISPNNGPYVKIYQAFLGILLFDIILFGILLLGTGPMVFTCDVGQEITFLTVR